MKSYCLDEMPADIEHQSGRCEPSPFADWDKGYASEDANLLHRIAINGEPSQAGFHVTTPEIAEKILAEGPKAFGCRVGHFIRGKDLPSAFWLNCVPWIPYSVEQYVPRFESDVDMAVLMVLCDKGHAVNCDMEGTWPFLQWPVLEADLGRIHTIAPVPPEDFPKFRSDEGNVALMGYLQRSLDVIPPGGYATQVLDQLTKELT